VLTSSRMGEQNLVPGLRTQRDVLQNKYWVEGKDWGYCLIGPYKYIPTKCEAGIEVY